MKKKLFTFIFFLLLGLKPGFLLYASYAEFDPAGRRIRLAEFDIGGHQISADFSYQVKEEGGHLLFLLEGRDLQIGERRFDSFTLKAVRRGNILFIEKFESLGFSGKGNIDLKEKSFLFELAARWQEDAARLKGEVELKAKAWGSFDNFLVSGNFNAYDGAYDDFVFERLRCTFFGSPPVFNLNDVELVLPGKGIFSLGGTLDIRDPDSFFPSAELISHKLLVEGWHFFADEGEVGLSKRIGDKFDFRVEAEGEGGAQLRYNLENNNFLKLRMQGDETILGVERRREF